MSSKSDSKGKVKNLNMKEDTERLLAHIKKSSPRKGKILTYFRVVGLWTGLGPNIIRNSIINAAEIATFDQVKDMIVRRNLMDDGIPCHLVSSAVAGFTACIVGSPVDVLKTRLMNAKVG